MRIILYALLLLFCIHLTAQPVVTNASFDPPTLNRDGDCVFPSTDRTEFMTRIASTNVNTGTSHVYMTDCNDKVISRVNIFGPATNYSVSLTLGLLANPDCSPFTLFASDDLTVVGAVHTGTKIGLLEFDPLLLDDDCPGMLGITSEPIPTLSQWGLLILGLIMLCIGVLAIKQTKRVAI